MITSRFWKTGDWKPWHLLMGPTLVLQGFLSILTLGWAAPQWNTKIEGATTRYKTRKKRHVETPQNKKEKRYQHSGRRLSTNKPKTHP